MFTSLPVWLLRGQSGGLAANKAKVSVIDSMALSLARFLKKCH